MTHADFSPLMAWMTGRFPNVEILATYTIEFDPSNEAKRILVKWLTSMPKIILLKLAQMPVPFYNAFMEDPRQYEDEPVEPVEPTEPNAEDDPESHIISPRLRSLHVTHIPKDVIIYFLNRRKQVGVPLSKVYIPCSWASHGLKEKDMREINATGSTIFVMGYGGATEEEMGLLARP